jgi:hypothetical protein
MLKNFALQRSCYDYLPKAKASRVSVSSSEEDAANADTIAYGPVAKRLAKLGRSS